MSNYHNFYFKKAGNMFLTFHSCYQQKSSIFSWFLCHLYHPLTGLLMCILSQNMGLGACNLDYVE